MSNSRQAISTSRLGPCTKPFSPMHRFALHEPNFPQQVYYTEQPTSKPLTSNIAIKENQPDYHHSRMMDQMNNLHCENDRLNNALKETNHELDRVRRRCDVLAVERNQLEEQLGYFRNVSAQTDNVYYTEFQQARAQCDEWKQRCQEIEMKVRTHSTEFQEHSREQNNKVALLTLEVERLTSLCLQRTAENDNLSQHLRQLYASEQEAREQLERRDREYLREEARDTQREYQQLESNRFSDVSFCQQTRYQEQEVKLALMSTEIDRLHQTLRQRSEEMQKVRFQSDGYQAETERLTKQLSQRPDTGHSEAALIQMSSEIERLNQQLMLARDEKRRDQQESERLKTIMRSLELRIKENEGKLTFLMQENQRLASLLQLHVEENAQLKDMMERDVAVDTWKRKFCDLNRDFHQVQEQLAMSQAELEATKAKITKKY